MISQECTPRSAEVSHYAMSGQSLITIPVDLAFEILVVLKKVDSGKTGEDTHRYDAASDRMVPVFKKTLSSQFQEQFKGNIDGANSDLAMTKWLVDQSEHNLNDLRERLKKQGEAFSEEHSKRITSERISEKLAAEVELLKSRKNKVKH